MIDAAAKNFRLLQGMHPMLSDDALRLGDSAYQSNPGFHSASQFRKRDDKTIADRSRRCDLDREEA
ncbi:hypothetical protein [Paraburkholderia phytofirmans]|uniref:hypothetical protein n=1 Tax=Paraburkholderia phytofirmans TaxID=261302 RepID=UPI0038BD253C